MKLYEKKPFKESYMRGAIWGSYIGGNYMNYMKRVRWGELYKLYERSYMSELYELYEESYMEKII